MDYFKKNVWIKTLAVIIILFVAIFFLKGLEAALFLSLFIFTVATFTAFCLNLLSLVIGFNVRKPLIFFIVAGVGFVVCSYLLLEFYSMKIYLKAIGLGGIFTITALIYGKMITSNKQ